MPITINVPRRTLLVLCGPAGSGKSTFAARRFGATTIVSSDHCRELICDDVSNQQVNRDAFDLFHYIIYKRLFQGRFTVADSTALHAASRRKLLEMARQNGYSACLLIFDIPEAICAARNLQRDRQVEAKVMPYHASLLRQTLLDVPNEGWDQWHILKAEQMDVIIEIENPLAT
jgi:predicted kinase